MQSDAATIHHFLNLFEARFLIFYRRRVSALIGFITTGQENESGIGLTVMRVELWLSHSTIRGSEAWLL